MINLIPENIETVTNTTIIDILKFQRINIFISIISIVLIFVVLLKRKDKILFFKWLIISIFAWAFHMATTIGGGLGTSQKPNEVLIIFAITLNMIAIIYSIYNLFKRKEQKINENIRRD